jgi:hypothetical protein
MNVRKLHGLMAVLLSMTTISQAQKKSMAVVPEDFQFGGTWDCVGAMGSGRTAHKSTFGGAMAVGGKWLELTEEDVQPATGYVAKYLIGYDPAQGWLVEFDANNFGAASYTSEDGWQNHVLTMTSPVNQDANAPYAVNRFIYTTKGPDTFSVDWQISGTAAVRWVQGDHLECKRRAVG